MLKWDKELVSTLTRVGDPIGNNPPPQTAKQDRKFAAECFKSILKFMGDSKKKPQYPDACGDEIAQLAKDNPLIRDEVYMCLIKQLTNNPNSESMSRGWSLMGRLLTRFPPSDDLANYLEVYLRDNGKKDLIFSMHSTIFQERPPQRSKDADKALRVDPRSLFAPGRKGARRAKFKGEDYKRDQFEVEDHTADVGYDKGYTPRMSESHEPAAPPPRPKPALPPPPSLPAEPKKLMAKCLYEYETDDPNQLSFGKDDMIEVVPPFDPNADWTLGKLNGREGYFPRTYAEIV
jgi:hypothetical protein